jgi:uncharacterized protein YecT (DUF1311 family)
MGRIMRKSIILLTFLAPVTAHATDPEGLRYGPEYHQCRNGTTVEIVDCVSKKAAAWDKRLNAAYKTLMTENDPARKASLRAAQNLWIKYRDANCAFYGTGQGSIVQIEVAECKRSMTQSRAIELEENINQE